MTTTVRIFFLITGEVGEECTGYTEHVAEVEVEGGSGEGMNLQQE